MPFIPHTPESLIARSDSRDPAATCRGITSTGRSCRRAVPGPPRTSASAISLIRSYEDTYCWQHRDQAVATAAAMPVGLQNETIKERTSIDTLVDRLGLIDIQIQHGGQKRSRKPMTSKPGPISAEPQLRKVNQERPDGELRRRTRSSRPKPPQRSRLDLFFTEFGLFCCLRVPDENLIAARPFSDVGVQEHKNSAIIGKPLTARQRRSDMQGRRKNDIQSVNMSISKPVLNTTKPEMQERGSEIPPKIPSTTINSINRENRSPEPHLSNQTRLSISRNPFSRTEDLLSLIPKTTTPEITSLLLAELAKPVSPHDEEGYIYMFWLTINALPLNASVAATSLLEPPTDTSSPRPRPGKRRESSVLQTFSSSPLEAKKTMLLKIGRASNVQRRLNEWSRQCGYNVSLIRYYPYQSTSQTPSPTAPSKVPHAHKVERLIHLELSSTRTQGGGKCVQCGSQHREWFEVEANREGIRGVDEVVRRWVDWGLRNG